MRARFLVAGTVLATAAGLLLACGFDDNFREYLSAYFWLPFAKGPAAFERPGVHRISAPFAGMKADSGNSPLQKLREAYQGMAEPIEYAFDPEPYRQMVAAARAAPSLSGEEKEEIDLIDAKIDMRAGEAESSELLNSARTKLESFLRKARTPAFRSEARGWLAHIHYLLKNQTAAGKIYLDELNRNGSNLSRETVLNSLRMTYGYNGGPQLLADLEEYFDTAEHAAFAIQLATNPRWRRSEPRFSWPDGDVYERIDALLEEHKALLRSNHGADVLAMLAMRTQLRAGHPAAAHRIAEAVPANARIRTDPDFRWMLASASFLSHEYRGAEQPLLALFQAASPHDSRKAAAAYALCGVYRKTGNILEQLRYPIWLHTAVREQNPYGGYWGVPSRIEDLSVYWASSGWDLNMLLESDAGLDALQAFVEQNPDLPGIRLVKYSLAVRLARENRYDGAAEIYQSINAVRRAPRMRLLDALYREANRGDLSAAQQQEAWYQVADFLQANANRIYFNDALWSGLQRYALERDCSDTRITRKEREEQLARERQLKDDQEERWRAYLILRKIVDDGGGDSLRAARLAIRCLRGINTDRFGREEEIRKADIDLSSWIRGSRVRPRAGVKFLERPLWTSYPLRSRSSLSSGGPEPCATGTTNTLMGFIRTSTSTRRWPCVPTKARGSWPSPSAVSCERNPKSEA
jgi:hypothetical protein